MGRSKRRRVIAPAPTWEEDPAVSAREAELAARARDALDGEAAFARYYRDAQRIARDDADWDELMASLHAPLPVSFRMSRVAGRQAEVAAALAEAAPLLAASHPLGARGSRTAPPARHFAWADAWQLGCDGKALRQAAKHAPESALAALGRWIVKHNASGVLTRQELVSMVPVSLLDVCPGHAVLDMCAAPGSKSTQALEALHAAPAADGGGGAPSGGFLVANELDGERSHTLANRCFALGGACAALIVTAQRAQTFPLPASARRFDRVICDVPCSGDGTFRKYPDKWAHYEPHLGRTLHALQLQIALRATAACAAGGLVAYSTCSLNPLEDEAVVAALLAKTGDALELVDVSERLRANGFRVRQGVQTWAVPDEQGRPLAAHADVSRARFRKTLWPPPPDAPQTAGTDLRRCVRVMPHDNDTGGFFVALLRKRAAWPAEAPARALAPCPCRPRSAGTAVRILVPATTPWLRSAPALEQLLRALASQLAGRDLVLCARSDTAVADETGARPRRIYLCTSAVAALAAGAADDDKLTLLRTISTGVCVAKSCRERNLPYAGTPPCWTLTAVGRRIAAGDDAAAARPAPAHGRAARDGDD